MKRSFEITGRNLVGARICLASYAPNCEESHAAFVLFERCGKLYRVQTWEDDLYGVMHAWYPKHTTIEELVHDLRVYNLGKSTDWEGGNIFAAELSVILDELVKKG